MIDLVSKFGSVSCSSASISWNPLQTEVRQSSFVLGFSSNTPALNSAKVQASSYAVRLFWLYLMLLAYSAASYYINSMNLGVLLFFLL